MFRIDGPFMQMAMKFTNVLYAHVLALFCALPILTAGAALTALEYTLLKISREEDSGITSEFFHSFKENFKQATILWLIYLVVGSLVLFDIYFFRKINTGHNVVMMYAMCIITILLVLNMTWGFVLLSRYNNSGIKTLKYALKVSLIYIVYTLLMLVMVALPLYLALENIQLAPYILVLGVTVSGFVRPKLYGRVFDKIEAVNENNRLKKTQTEEETI